MTRLVVLVAALFLTACGSSRSHVARPVTLTAVSGDGQTGPIGVVLPVPFCVSVDPPAPGILVLFFWFDRGQPVTGVLTDYRGIAETCEHPIAIGPATLTARADGAVNEITFTMTGS